MLLLLGCHMFNAPIAHNSETSPYVSDSQSQKWSYLNNLQPTTVLCKVCKITVPAKCGTNKYVLQVGATTLAAGDLPPKCKQMIQPSIAGTLTSYTSYGRKSKRWLEIHGCSVEKRIFKQRVKKLNSEYMCPGGKCFQFQYAIVVSKLLKSYKFKLLQVLQAVFSFFSFYL